MTTIRFKQESEPARSIGELVAFLQNEHKPKFVYRGQTKSRPFPLFPSAFRYYVQTGKIFSRTSSLPFDSLRSSGQVFYELEPINFLWEFADRFCGTSLLSQPELEMINDLVDNPWFSLELQTKDDGCFESWVSPEFDRKFSYNYGLWKLVINQLHRNRIRQLVCLNPFSYVLGMAIAQHYGFSSEALDVTHDPIVAGFFATHEFPHYRTIKQSGIGIIYRFRLTEHELNQGAWSWLDKDFYNTPSFIDLPAILSPILANWLSYAESFQNLIDHIQTSLQEGFIGRKAHSLQIGEDAISNTRVSRQKASLIVPDLLLKEQVIQDMKIQRFIAVEDISNRLGAEQFYFFHRPNEWSFKAITREYLWPEQDLFVDMFDMVLSKTFPMVLHPTGIALPKRRDLLDRGYLK
jgi:hypothetical protein